MTSRDERLAAKMREKNPDMKSATQAAEDRADSRSRVPDDAGGSVLDQLRSFNWEEPRAIERDADSRRRAASYRRSVPPLP